VTDANSTVRKYLPPIGRRREIRSSHSGFAAALCLFVSKNSAGNGMEDDTEAARFKPPNDNIGPHGEPDAEEPSVQTWQKIDRVALTLARIIGRRMAQKDFAARVAANDNRPIVSEKTEDGADKE
jgi:hypothetical protein